VLLVYLPNALTELAFRQAIGRVVRSAGLDDDTRAYVVMPAFDTFEEYARRVEDEMSPAAKGDGRPSQDEAVPNLRLGMRARRPCLRSCSHDFPVAAPRFKPCGDCGALNPMGAQSCNACGKTFATDFVLTLDEALRNGAIVRGMDLDEREVCAAEQIAPEVRARALRTGDETLVRLLRTLPDESWARLRDILAPAAL
jgi:hypothetical protein